MCARANAVAGGCVMLTWKGDHEPRHVHVYRNGKLVVKWDVQNGIAMAGRATRKVVELVQTLEAEGLL